MGSSAFAMAGTVTIPGWLTGIIAFTVVMISEIAWVLCVRWSAHSKVLKAAFGASAMVLVGWIGIIVLLGNPLVAIPCEMVGAFAGTIIAIKVDNYGKSKG
jgi:hypothetical protein